MYVCTVQRHPPLVVYVQFVCWRGIVVMCIETLFQNNVYEV